MAHLYHFENNLVINQVFSLKNCFHFSYLKYQDLCSFTVLFTWNEYTIYVSSLPLLFLSLSMTFKAMPTVIFMMWNPSLNLLKSLRNKIFIVGKCHVFVHSSWNLIKVSAWYFNPKVLHPEYSEIANVWMINIHTSQGYPRTSGESKNSKYD